MTVQPLQCVLAVLSGWRNEQQPHVVDTSEENRLLKRQFRGQRLRRTDDGRRRLAKASSSPQPAHASRDYRYARLPFSNWHRKLVGRTMTAAAVPTCTSR